MKKTALTFAAALAALALLGSCKVVETETETEYVDKIVEVEKSDKTPSAAVTAVKAIAGNGKVMLSWQEPADADFYGVRISGSPAAGTLKSPVVVQKGVTSLSAADLVNGTAYTFTLTALDAALNESGPATVKATPVDAADTTPLADVTALTATNKGGSVLLTWTDNNADSDLFGYEVSYRRAENTDAETVVATVAQGTQRCYVDGLSNGTAYTFTVRSVDTSGNHSAGATATCTPAPLALSIALTVPSDPADDGSTITLSNDSADVNVKLTIADAGAADDAGSDAPVIEKAVWKAGAAGVVVQPSARRPSAAYFWYSSISCFR